MDQFGAEKLVGFIMIDGTPKSKGTDFTEEWVWWGTKDEGDQDDFFKYFSYDLLLDRQGVNRGFAEWMLEDASPENVAFVLDMTSHTSDAVAALLNTAGWFDDYSATLIALDGRIPLLYVVREEWRDLATQWASRNTPSAEVVAFGKHMMFWERPEEFNAVLDRRPVRSAIGSSIARGRRQLPRMPHPEWGERGRSRRVPSTSEVRLASGAKWLYAGRRCKGDIARRTGLERPTADLAGEP